MKFDVGKDISYFDQIWTIGGWARLQGESYYFLTRGTGNVAMLPADVVEANAEYVPSAG